MPPITPVQNTKSCIVAASLNITIAGPIACGLKDCARLLPQKVLRKIAKDDPFIARRGGTDDAGALAAGRRAVRGRCVLDRLLRAGRPAARRLRRDEKERADEAGRRLAQHEGWTRERAFDVSPGGGSAIGSDGERAPPCRSPLPTNGAGRWVRGRAGQRERRLGSQPGDRVAEGAADDLGSLGRRAGTNQASCRSSLNHPGGLDALRSRRPRLGRTRRSIVWTGRSSWP